MDGCLSGFYPKEGIGRIGSWKRSGTRTIGHPSVYLIQRG